MAICAVCGQEIARGKRYKGEKYGNVALCSELCYAQYCKDKERSNLAQPYRQLKDYINGHFPDPINWTAITKQIKTICEDYKLDHNRLRLILKYAIEYEGDVPKYNNGERFDLGLYQYIPKYIDPVDKFINQIYNNKQIADGLEGDDIFVVPTDRKITRYWKGDADF